MANKKLSAITASSANLAATDGLVGVFGGFGGTADYLFAPAQLQAAVTTFPVSSASLNNVPATAPAAPAILSLAGAGTANVIFNLPAATAGALYLVACGVKSTGSGQLTANGTDLIRYNGTSGAAGGNLKTTVGSSSGLLFCPIAGAWAFFASGTWTLT